MKATEQYFPVMLFITPYKLVLTFEYVDKILKCDHSVLNLSRPGSKGFKVHCLNYYKRQSPLTSDINCNFSLWTLSPVILRSATVDSALAKADRRQCENARPFCLPVSYGFASDGKFVFWGRISMSLACDSYE